jgi:hypothetical protein
MQSAHCNTSAKFQPDGKERVADLYHLFILFYPPLTHKAETPTKNGAGGMGVE